MQGIAEQLAKLPSLVDDFAKKLGAEAKDSDRALASYAGMYANEEIGSLVIREQGGALHATVGDRASTLVRVRGDAFYVRWYTKEAPERIVFSDEALTWGEWTFVRRE